MEVLRTVFIIWASLGLVSTLIGVMRLKSTSTDCGIRISVCINLIYSFVTLVSAWLAWEPIPSWWLLTFSPMGGFLILLSQALALWAKRELGGNFSTDLSPKAEGYIVKTGPFALCRHPMMLSYLLMWGGTMLALGSLIMLLGFGFFSILVFWRVALEEKALKAKYGLFYLEYANETSPITPSLRSFARL